MAITEEERVEPLPELPPAPERHEPLGVFKRPMSEYGWRSWLTTVDHKKIGIMYGAAALLFFALGGLEALVMRAQLAGPSQELIDADTYNQFFTMHGTTMVFLVIMPLAAAFANYLIPLQIGARDVAFPRLNAFGLWTFIAGGLFLYSSFLLGDAPDGGWFGYAPNTTPLFSPGNGIDFWVLGLQILGIASLSGSVNLIVTVLNMRAPGMTFMRMPIFTWMMLVVQFLLLFAIPVITVALFLLMFDRLFDGNFFRVSEGADPLLWQHLFWIFGHPEVYILILPSFGIVSEILPTFSKKPLFGYPFMVFSGIAIGFMGWGVWVHHMFASGVGPIAVATFSLSTMFIAVPTGVKIFNWLGTMWGGNIRFTTPMLFAIGLVAMFTIGGLSGVTHAVAPHDTQQTDTYYIVAHFHYVLFGGAMFGIFAGFYYWWPKVFGRMLRDGLGKLHFWTMLLGFNLAFGPMHVLGLQGMPRRIHTYADDMGWDFWNAVSTVGAFLIGVSFLLFMYNIWTSRHNHIEDSDPWDGRSLEWMTDSPPAIHNFDEIPTVAHLDEYFHRKYQEDDTGKLVRLASSEQVHDQAHTEAEEHHAAEHLHMPSPSYWPIVCALGLPLIGYGLIFNLGIAVVGGLLVVAGIYGWGLEPSVEPEPPEDHAPPEPPGPPEQPAAEAAEPEPEQAEPEPEEAPVG